MDTRTKAKYCMNQLLYGLDFLDIYRNELRSLFADEEFRAHMDAIEKGQQEETVYPSDTKWNKKFKNEVLNRYFYESRIYYHFPAYASIADDVVKHGGAKISAAISVFYAMKYWEHKIAEEMTGKQPEPPAKKQEANADYRKKHDAEYRCEDGHYVRSKNEQLVDNWLYYHNVVHAYEKLVIDRETRREYLCDFYLPTMDTYIEVWGFENEEYLRHKEEKTAVYQKNEMKLLSMTNHEIKNLDDFLNRMILR